MPSIKRWLGLCAVASFLDLTLTASAPLQFDFTKIVARNTPHANNNRLRRRASPVNVAIDNADIAYLINITIGTPPQPFSVQLDTGSADIWVPSASSDVCTQDQADCQVLGAFDLTNSKSFISVAQNAFSIQYEDNSQVTGDYFNDTLAFGNIQITNMTMGLAQSSSRPLGIMGIGYEADETAASSSGENPDAIYANVVSQLKMQGAIDSRAYSLWLNDLDSLTGSILFGGLDTAKYHGDLISLPVQKGSNGTYKDFTVALSSVSVVNSQGASQFSANSLALPVILDSGTTATYLPDDIAQSIIGGVGATTDNDYGLIVPCGLQSSSANFAFGFGGSGGPSINVGIGEFVFPIQLDDGSVPEYSDGSSKCGFGLMSAGTSGGPILLGDTFLRSAYVVYDLQNNQIGMAQTTFNTTDTNVVAISGTSIPGATVTASGVAVTQTYTGVPLETVAHTKNGGKQAGGHPTGTFSLGPTSGKHSGGLALPAPRIGAAAAVSGFVVLISMIFGSSLLLMTR